MNIAFPFRFDGRGRSAGADEPTHIRDLIEQFLFTNPGERVNRPEFGSGLLGMVFEPNSPELATVLQSVIQGGLQRWLGELIEVRELAVSSREATLQVEVKYVLRRSEEVYSETFERDIP